MIAIRAEIQAVEDGTADAVALNEFTGRGVLKDMGLSDDVLLVAVGPFATMALAVAERLRKQGIGVVFISHNVRHALAVGDRFTVLNRGKTLGTAQRGEISPEQLQDLMAGGQEMAQLEGSLGGTV
mgnify:CR=1 FL=1